ncbi:BadF/BadG/BcrA/BcrD ATPase family protein [Janthinobacterium sp. HH103]|uniref:BadF/BadG/BcrA/BcrD ATPase family protein n=1 Tax=unclassified Janthinobacterium TaxID=2610881 RepID=UPI000874A684|nr:MULTISPECIES: BadF/BadG/BcrA/BcrD ATPase family protein [unclassified Janthinobacterium]OEZ55912.1 BadF/BadG/BcrA/BcrD ATPase family protein [Janthinobacterium sp. HH100]OEZ70579.1 BadF/BadG/BcrA/BcrD ATPase family protein [Janthinobacterium sp. HH103]QOU70787.1 BadF/BadG/BcrA/BcrD ATPase family protein [Janthinobacterium sp. HH102]
MISFPATNTDTAVLGLGIDAGGTQTRWALATADGTIVADGAVEGLSALQMSSDAGRAAVHATFAILCKQVLAVGQPRAVVAGLTGFGGDDVVLAKMLSALLALNAGDVSIGNDIDIAYRDSFEPGEGYLVYAGTGSIAAWIDADGVFHRAGGRGVLLDDGGGGYWIAREALRHIWRREDEAPGSWHSSPMAEAVFAQLGGSDWSLSRAFMYGQDRGAIGRLALAVAASADADPLALDILQRAGQELARLALALTARYGPRPVVLAGRAAQLHPAIAAAMCAALPVSLMMEQKVARSHEAAAKLAARAASQRTGKN